MEFRKLSEISNIIMGQSPNSNSYNEVGAGVPFFQGKADFGELNPTVRVFCSEPTKLADELDILMSVRAPVGDVNIANQKCCIGRGLCAIRGNKEVNNKYLYYYLLTVKDILNSKATGSTFKAINKSVLEELMVPMITLEIQDRIVKVLDKAQDLINRRKEQLECLDELIKSRFIEMFGELEESIEPVDLEELAEFITVGIANSATQAYTDLGIAMLRNQNIKENKLDDKDLIYIIPEFANKYKNKALKEGDILVTRTGYPGVACMVPKKYEGCQTFTTLIVRLKRKENINPFYICHYINSSFGKAYVDKTKVGVAQQNFGAKTLDKMPILLPPIEYQNEFIQFAEKVDKLKFKVENSLKELEDNFNSLMQKAFKGELFN